MFLALFKGVQVSWGNDSFSLRRTRGGRESDGFQDYLLPGLVDGRTAARLFPFYLFSFNFSRLFIPTHTIDTRKISRHKN